MKNAIHSVDKETFERIWKIVEQIGVQERHFNGLQTGYRNMASVWLLAAFSGIGFALSQTIHVAIDPELLIAGMGMAGSIGIALLWVLDLLVYHRLLDSCFIEGLILEEHYPWLPQLRSNMMHTQAGQGVLFRTAGFYIAPVALLILITGAALALWFYRQEHPIGGLLSGVASMICSLVAGMGIWSKSENTLSLKNRLAIAKKN